MDGLPRADTSLMPEKDTFTIYINIHIHIHERLRW